MRSCFRRLVSIDKSTGLWWKLLRRASTRFIMQYTLSRLQEPSGATRPLKELMGRRNLKEEWIVIPGLQPIHRAAALSSSALIGKLVRRCKGMHAAG
jgi:hypothetical protein